MITQNKANPGLLNFLSDNSKSEWRQEDRVTRRCVSITSSLNQSGLKANHYESDSFGIHNSNRKRKKKGKDGKDVSYDCDRCNLF